MNFHQRPSWRSFGWGLSYLFLQCKFYTKVHWEKGVYGGAWGGGVQGVSPHFSQFSFCLFFFSVSSRRRRRRGLHTAISNKACAQTSKQASQPALHRVRSPLCPPCAFCWLDFHENEITILYGDRVSFRSQNSYWIFFNNLGYIS